MALSPDEKLGKQLAQFDRRLRDTKIQVLAKQVELETDPAIKADLGFRLTYERLRRLNESGRVR